MLALFLHTFAPDWGRGMIFFAISEEVICLKNLDQNKRGKSSNGYDVALSVLKLIMFAVFWK